MGDSDSLPGGWWASFVGCKRRETSGREEFGTRHPWMFRVDLRTLET